MQEYLAIASVPVQSCGELFQPEEALRVGTIFRDLDKPFFAASKNIPADRRGSAAADPASAVPTQADSMPADPARAVSAQAQTDSVPTAPSQAVSAQADPPSQAVSAQADPPSQAVSAQAKYCCAHTAASVQQNPGCADRPGQQERERALLKIQETGFVLDDLRLYLDTHPDDRQGLALLKDRLRERKELLKTYALQFYPLTPDCAADIYEKEPALECWCWQKGPMPWEGACV